MVRYEGLLVDNWVSNEEMGEVPVAARRKQQRYPRNICQSSLEKLTCRCIKPTGTHWLFFGGRSSGFKELLKTAVECFTARDLSFLSWKLHLFWTVLFARKIGETARSRLVFHKENDLHLLRVGFFSSLKKPTLL